MAVDEYGARFAMQKPAILRHLDQEDFCPITNSGYKICMHTFLYNVNLKIVALMYKRECIYRTCTSYK